jgi:predicted enzyme related to lactoylglutathione lyase
MKVRAFFLTFLLIGLYLGRGGLAEETQSQAKAKEENVPRSNPVVFWELASHDAEASVGFFKEIFGWEIEKEQNTILYIADSRGEDQGVAGGIFTLQKAKLPFLTIYILVDDIEEKAKLVEKAGGLIIEPPQKIKSGSWICLFNDPSGVTFAMLQKAPAEE